MLGRRKNLQVHRFVPPPKPLRTQSQCANSCRLGKKFYFSSNDNELIFHSNQTQLTLIPRIDVTSIFSGSIPADYRKQDFDYYRCNDSYYDVGVRDINKRCEELFQMAGTLVYDGASRKFQPIAIYFKSLSYRPENMKKKKKIIHQKVLQVCDEVSRKYFYFTRLREFSRIDYRTGRRM